MAALVVHLVPGTWAYGRAGKAHVEARRRLDPGSVPPFWFEEGSAFRDALGAAAPGLEVRVVEWSFENAFADRRDAARALRATLEAAVEADPSARHVVVGHSHGGTVGYLALARETAPYEGNPGLEALDRALPRRPDPLAGRVVGLLTLGTPFATLRARGFDTPADWLRGAASRWGAVLVLSALAAGTAWAGLGWAPVAAGFVFVACSLALGWLLVSVRGLGLFEDPAGVHALCGPAAPALPCGLTALRVPRDEAGMAIAAAETVDWLLGFVSSRVLPQRLRAWARDVSLWTVGLGLWAGLSVALLLADLARGEGLEAWMRYVLGGLEAAAVVAVVAPVVVGVALPLAVTLGQHLLARATGPEVLRYAGYVSVEVEPVPVGVEARLEVFPLAEDERASMAMAHSLHALPAVQARVAAWVAAHRARVEAQ